MRIITFILFFVICFSLKAQFLHTPIQIETIKKESSIQYHLDSINPNLQETSPKLLTFSYETTVRRDTSLIHGISIELSNKELKHLKKADQYYSNKKYKQAVSQYQKSTILSEIPAVMARIAYCYQQINKTKEAVLIYKHLLESDSSNAFLHLQLANCHYQLEEYKLAKHQITLAHLFNRNNKVYLDVLSNIYAQQNLKFRLLDFQPKYDIKATGDQVIIKANTPPWIAYATAKAIWKYEPGYRETMNYISSEDSRIIEEKECLFNALIAYERLDITEKINFPGLYTLSSALPDKRVNDFIMYEISLTQHPEMASRLSEERITKLIDYIYNYRVKSLDISQ